MKKICKMGVIIVLICLFCFPILTKAWYTNSESQDLISYQMYLAEQLIKDTDVWNDVSFGTNEEEYFIEESTMIASTKRQILYEQVLTEILQKQLNRLEVQSQNRTLSSDITGIEEVLKRMYRQSDNKYVRGAVKSLLEKQEMNRIENTDDIVEKQLLSEVANAIENAILESLTYSYNTYHNDYETALAINAGVALMYDAYEYRTELELSLAKELLNQEKYATYQKQANEYLNYINGKRSIFDMIWQKYQDDSEVVDISLNDLEEIISDELKLTSDEEQDYSIYYEKNENGITLKQPIMQFYENEKFSMYYMKIPAYIDEIPVTEVDFQEYLLNQEEVLYEVTLFVAENVYYYNIGIMIPSTVQKITEESFYTKYSQSYYEDENAYYLDLSKDSNQYMLVSIKKSVYESQQQMEGENTSWKQRTDEFFDFEDIYLKQSHHLYFEYVIPDEKLEQLKIPEGGFQFRIEVPSSWSTEHLAMYRIDELGKIERLKGSICKVDNGFEFRAVSKEMGSFAFVELLEMQEIKYCEPLEERYIKSNAVYTISEHPVVYYMGEDKITIQTLPNQNGVIQSQYPILDEFEKEILATELNQSKEEVENLLKNQSIIEITSIAEKETIQMTVNAPEKEPIVYQVKEQTDGKIDLIPVAVGEKIEVIDGEDVIAYEWNVEEVARYWVLLAEKQAPHEETTEEVETDAYKPKEGTVLDKGIIVPIIIIVVMLIALVIVFGKKNKENA